MTRPLLFDAVLFDLDGTLVATDRFWVQAARTGARRAFEELGLERELPSREEWMSLVGYGLESGFRTLFADLEERQWRRVMQSCEEEEARLLSSGRAALMPGARELLTELTLRGARLGIASNCARGYLDHMLDELGLGELVHGAYCLDSTGVEDKEGMIASLLESFGTRSAVMVGDRTGDRDAAWANGLPHVHCSFGFAAPHESIAADATIEDLLELVEVFDRRRIWIETVLERVGLRLDRGGPFVLGVTGEVLSGKSLFARDVARVLRARGLSAVAVSLAGYARPDAGGAAGPEEAFDLDRLDAELLSPHGDGASVRIPIEACLEAGTRIVPEESILVLDGPFLLDPRIASRLDRVLWLEAGDEVRWRRISGRDGRAPGQTPLGAIEEARSGPLSVGIRHRAEYPPERLADLTLDASNPLGPEVPA